MPVEPLTDIAYVTGEAISEKVGEKLEHFWYLFQFLFR